MKFNIFIDTKAIVIQMMKQLFMASNQLRVKGVFVADMQQIPKRCRKSFNRSHYKDRNFNCFYHFKIVQ
jgi:hypothetical protein